MSTIAVKLTSLAVRTLAKPIANSIKQQAKEHPSFRAICIAIAQTVHRTDMRIRLNLLRDSSVIEKAEEEEERRKAVEKEKDEKQSISKLASEALKQDKESTKMSGTEHGQHTPPSTPSSDHDSAHHHHPAPAPKKKKSSTVHIRPLSDSKAIERGAAFISEFFLFSVAGGLILFEALRSRKKELNRRDEIADRLQSLEEVDEIWRRKVEMLERRLDQAGIKSVPELPSLPEEKQAPLPPEGWISKLTSYFSKPLAEADENNQSLQKSTKPDAIQTKA